VSTIVIGCDRNNGNDSKWQSTVAKALEKQGHSVEKLDIGPNAFASYSYSGKAKGKIGIFLIAAGLTALCDLYDGNTSFKYAYFGIRGDIGNGISSMNDFNTKGIHKDHHGDCISKSCNSFNGKTYPQINKITKSKCQAVYGGSPEEMGKNIIAAMGGSTSDSSDDKKSSSGGTVKESIQKLLKHWDGEVECYIRDGKVYINKIKEPKSDYHLLLQEGVNILSDSIQITDVNPNTVNYLIVKWTGGTITIKDEELIKRFGEVKSEVEAVRKIVKTETTQSSSSDSDIDTDMDTDTDTDTDTDIDTDTDTTTTTTKTTVVEEPIKTYEEALAFANTEWNKIKRDNGHTFECKVLGGSQWRSGEWVKVIAPSFNENGFMYLTRVSESDDAGDWTCNLALVDYPPGWGAEELSTSSDDSSDSDSSDDSS